MAIEFRCPSCEQLLRVPEDAAGKNARCPKCGALATIPSPAAAAGPAPSPPPTPPIPPAMPPASPFGDAAQPAGSSPFAGGNPFAADYPAKPSLNPYAPPSAGYATANLGVPSSPILNQRVEVGHVWNYAWQIWQNNLGLLVGVLLLMMAINYALAIPMMLIQWIAEMNDAPELGAVALIFGYLVSIAAQTFLQIGQVQIALKLVRQQPAAISDLFGGGSRFLPVLGMMLIAFIPAIVAYLLCIVPLFVLLLFFWPCYYLVVDAKCNAVDSFTLATTVTEGNRMTTFLLWLLSFAVALIGLLAFCIGIIFAAPLITIMWATAYLMMSGQLAAWPTQAAPGYGAAVPQMPGK